MSITKLDSIGSSSRISKYC